MRARGRIRTWAIAACPDLPFLLLSWSLVAGAALLVAAPLIRSFPPLAFSLPNQALVDNLVLAAQGVLTLYLIYLIGRYISSRSPVTGRWLSYVPALVVVALMLSFELLIEDYLLKPMFYASRPPDAAVTHTTARLGELIGIGRGEGTAVPSGMAMRQTIIAMYVMVLAKQKPWPPIRTFLLSHTFLYPLAFVTSTIVFFGRVASGAHYFFDVAIGIVFGTFLFSLMMLSWATLAKGGPREFIHIQRFLVQSLFFLVVLLLYTQDAVRWTIFSGGSILVTSLLYDYAPRKSSEADAGVDPLSWTPDPLGEGGSRWPSPTVPIPRSSAAG